MRSYEAARGYFGFIEFVAWVIIVLGGIVAAAASMNAPNALSGTMLAMPGIMLCGVGFFIIVNAQTARAAVDSAEYGQQALQVSRNQLDVSKQLLKLAEAREAVGGYAAAAKANDLKNISFDTDAPANAPQSTVAGAITHQYKGHVFEEKDGKFLFDGRSFDTRLEATIAIDKASEFAAIEAS